MFLGGTRSVERSNESLSVAADICNQLLGRHNVELAKTNLAALRNQMRQQRQRVVL
jgi:hypothetical protein